MLVVGPSCAGGVDRGPDIEVVDEEVGEVEGIALFNDPIEGKSQNACGSAAAPVVVPEAGADPLRQTRCCDGVPALIRELLPEAIAGDLGQEPKHLSIAGRTVAPAEAVPLDDGGTVGWVGVSNQEPLGALLIATDDVGCTF